MNTIRSTRSAIVAWAAHWMLAGCGASVMPVDGQTAATDASSGSPDVETQPNFYGFVEARVAQSSAGNEYTGFADFVAATSMPSDTCAADSGVCCCVQGLPLPWPTGEPGAGVVTLQQNTTMDILATLTPSESMLDGSVTTQVAQGTSDLGLAWFAMPGSYSYVTSPAWRLGDGLSVSASGGQVGAFSGTLQTGALLSGVTPTFGTAPMVINRSGALQVGWTPEGGLGADVLVILTQSTTTTELRCFCAAPDTAGSLTVDSTTLSSFGTNQLSGSIQLERRVTTVASAPNARIELVGVVATSAQATFE